jgi:hypothetical protein
LKRYGSIVRPEPEVTFVAAVFAFVAMLVPEATVFAPGPPITTVLALVPGLPGLPIATAVALELIAERFLGVMPGAVTELPGVVDPIAFVCPVGFPVAFSWLLVLPTWPTVTFGLTCFFDAAEFTLASLELVVRFELDLDR